MINRIVSTLSPVSHFMLKPKTLFFTGVISFISISSPFVISRMAYCKSTTSDNLILYSFHHSFYAQKVLLVLHEKSIPFKVNSVDITRGENYDEPFLKINPRGEVPVLKVGEDIIPDSARIINYLEEHYSNENHPSLTPDDPKLREQVKVLRDDIDVMPANKITFAAANHDEVTTNLKYPFSISFARQGLKDSFKKSIPTIRKAAETTTNPETRKILLQKLENQEIEEQTIASMDTLTELIHDAELLLDKIEKQLQTLEPNTKWLVSNQFTLADVSLAIYLDRLHRIGLSDSLWNANNLRPLLKEYYKRVSERPSFQCAVPHVSDDVKHIFKRFWPF